MQAFELDNLVTHSEQEAKPYLEFIRVPALSVGVYELKAGSTDPQSPHTEDEVYYVVRGKGQIRVGDEHHRVQAGSVIYVARNVEHRFHSIEADLAVLVFFAPAEYTNKA